MKRIRLNRRTWLRGAGATVALPLLQAMLDEKGRPFMNEAQAANGLATPLPPRLLTVFHPFGWGNAGSEQTLLLDHCANTNTLKSFADAGKVRVITNLNKHENKWRAGDASSHGNRHASFATGMPAVPDLGGGGPSIDVIAARNIKPNTRFETLAAGCRNPGLASSRWVATMSWQEKGVPNPTYVKPAELFNRLFGGAGVPHGKRDYRKSVLDHVLADLHDLSARVGTEDRAILDRHATHVRELEQDIGFVASCNVPQPPASDAATEYFYSSRCMRQIIDLYVLGISCQLFRYGSLQLGCRVDGRAAGFDVPAALQGASGASEFVTAGQLIDPHTRSHSTSGLEFQLYRANLESTMSWVAYFLKGLAALDDGGGRTVLDNSIVFHASENQDGNHSYDRMPVAIYGTAGGTLRCPQHVTAPKDSPYSGVLASILTLAGVPTSEFGTLDRSAVNVQAVPGTPGMTEVDQWAIPTRGAPPFEPLLTT